MMDDATPPFGSFDGDGMSKSIRNEMMIRRLAMQANQLSEAIAYLWDGYQDMFDVVDLSDEAMYDRCCDVVTDLEKNLTHVLASVQEHKTTMCGYFEPVPDVSGIEDDFEASVLRGIADLDNFDFSVFEEAPDVENLIKESTNRVSKMTMDQLVNHVRSQYYE